VRDHAVGPTACKVTQPSLRCRTAPDPTALLNPALTQHGAAHVKTPLTAEPSCKDEARVGQQGTLTYVWAEKGSRPRAPKDLRYEWAYLFGAVCAERGVGAALVLPYANANAMTLHLAEVSRQVAPGAHAVLVCDGAGWHRTGGRLRVPSNITLLRLPPYSPELNPVENIWEYLRANKLSNSVFDTYDTIHRRRWTDIVDRCCAAWNWLTETPERIRSVAAAPWTKTVKA